MLRIRNTYRFTTATMVERALLSVRLYVHYLSSYIQIPRILQGKSVRVTLRRCVEVRV